MCLNCKQPNCPGCPPAGLTKRELEKNGWTNQPSQEELQRIIDGSRKATEQGSDWQGWSQTNNQR